MTWRSRVWRLLRWPALAAGGMTTAALGANASAAMGDGLEAPGNPDRGPVLLPNTLNATAENQYAAHRSHSSHRSHRSHRSSSGGVRSTPAPQPQYQPPPSNQAPSVIPRTTPRIERTIPKPTPPGRVEDGDSGPGGPDAPRFLQRGHRWPAGTQDPCSVAGLSADRRDSSNRAHGHRDAHAARHLNSVTDRVAAALAIMR